MPGLWHRPYRAFLPRPFAGPWTQEKQPPSVLFRAWPDTHNRPAAREIARFPWNTRPCMSAGP
jgi:hypothetical protein